MAQDARFIDVTRSFIPVNPNAFPETLHVSGREDSPENRIPAMAYKGYNFLPTAHGYKSYFGIAQNVGINAITARVDDIFIFQNLTYENVFIALTESGIWVKDGATSGAWTQLLVIAPPVDPSTHFNWTYAIIEDTLYCYMENGASYYTIVSAVTTPFVTLATVVPTFLNMAGQVGIFRAGGRLGFWDTANSFAWSSTDSFQDFTPSVTTLAGSAKFIDLVGRVVTVKPHGDGFMIYATQSIIYVMANPEKAFQWDPFTIFTNSGIAYAGNCCVATPDTTHFAYTNTGLYKIEKAKAEIIVPEVTDYLAAEDGPIYLKILEGRYLFFSLINEDFIVGEAQFTEEIVPAVDYVFPGTPLVPAEYIEGITLTGNSTCAILDRVSKGAFTTQADPIDKKPGTTLQPNWTCYVDWDQSDVAITWDNTPVATIDPNGVEKNHCPNGPRTLSQVTIDGTGPNMRPVVNLFTSMESFIDVQMALWGWQDENRAAKLAEMEARSSTGVKISNAGAPYIGVPTTVNKAYIDVYPAKYSAPKFDFDHCSFWLIRECIEAAELYRMKRNVEVAVDTRVAATLVGYAYANPGAGGVIYGTPTAALAALFISLGGSGAMTGPTYADASSYTALTVTGNYFGGDVWVATANPGPPYGAFTATEIYSKPSGFTSSFTGAFPTRVGYVHETVGRYKKTETMNANNVMDERPALIPQVAYCKITSYSYTKNDNSTGTITPDDACNAGLPENMLNGPGRGNIPIDRNGSLCGIPFTPIAIPGSPVVNVTWPTETVTIPAGSFLLQKGSIAPLYPTFAGAFVYDLHLKKWGKMKVSHKHLVNYQPINTQARGVVPYESFGITAGVLMGDGLIYLFDKYPIDSWITYGKIGYYRLGITSCEEVIVQFKEACTGTLEIDASMDGQNLTAGFSIIQPYTYVGTTTVKGGPVGRWFNITLRGQYDISYLEIRGFRQGRR